MNKFRLSRIIMKSTDLGLAVLFLAAALPKIANPDSFADSIASFRIAPTWAINPLAYSLPWFEGLCAALLAMGLTKSVSRRALVGLLISYTALTLVALARGIDIHCGCFGGEGSSAWTVIVRNSLVLSILGGLWILCRKLGGMRCPTGCHRPRASVRMAYGISVTLVSLLPITRQSCATSGPPTTQAVTRPLTQPTRDDLKPGKKFIRTYTLLQDWRAKPMKYHINLPPDFRVDRKYPILFEWPGKGGGPRTNLFPGVYHLTGHIHVGLTYPKGCRSGAAMLYATKEYIAFMRHVYEDVVKNFNGNPDYVFIGGYSAGGFMAAGPGISLMIRAGLRDRLAGVVAGGCNWMCNPKYAKGVNILLWYADNDPNSSDLTSRIPELRKYAKSLTLILHKGAGHRCDNNFEGPAIRRFFALNGPKRNGSPAHRESKDSSLSKNVPPD